MTDLNNHVPTTQPIRYKTNSKHALVTCFFPALGAWFRFAHWLRVLIGSLKRGEEQNREEGEMAQTKLGGGRNRGKK